MSGNAFPGNLPYPRLVSVLVLIEGLGLEIVGIGRPTTFKLRELDIKLAGRCQWFRNPGSDTLVCC